MFGRLVSSLFVAAQRITPAILPVNAFQPLSAPGSSSIANAWSLMQVRTKMRCHFPRPGETKRIKKHGWLTRMSTPNGRKVLMRRILKGRHVLSH